MNKWDRDLFDGKCPYTDKPCKSDIDCIKCEINEQEKNYMNEEDADADSD